MPLKELWFDVEKERDTTIDYQALPKNGCGLM